MQVPNQQSKEAGPYRIAIIGEAPGIHEEAMNQPFVGPSGILLNSLLSRAGIDRSACYIGNVAQFRPPANDFAQFLWGDNQIQSGITALLQEVTNYRPNLIVCLGNAPLHVAKVGNVPPSRIKDTKGRYRYKWPNSISNWRGSMFWSDVFDCKVMSSYHPAACLRQFSWKPILHLDLVRAAKEALTTELVLPKRNLEVNLSSNEIIYRLNEILRNRCLVSVDIEGYVDAMSCIGFATSASNAFVVPFVGPLGGNRWDSVEEEVAVWQAVVSVLQDPNVPKVLQNSLYDRFVLHYSYGICVRGVADDTMLKHWENYCELEKSLAFQTSIYTKEPFYKNEGQSEDYEERLTYCAKDAAVTYEINECLSRFLDDRAVRHYRFNVDLLNPILAMELQGIAYNVALAKERRAAILTRIYEVQYELDCVAGLHQPYTNSEIFEVARAVHGKKKPTITDWDLLKHNCYKDSIGSVNRLCQMVTGSEPAGTPAWWGEVDTLLEKHLNVGSNDQLCRYLYRELKLPLQTDFKTKAPTADYEAVLKLAKKTSHPACLLILEIRTLTTRANMLEISADSDGRIRCAYNVVGTETGRLTCYTSPTGSGYNLQTIPSENLLKPPGHPLRMGMRDLILADDGYWFFQCDLSGADLWTVAAHCAALGDPTMLDDLKCGLKPAKILALGVRGDTRYLDPKCPRDEIREACKKIEKDSWEYFACKIGVHGTNYTMGPRSLSDKIFVESEGSVMRTENEVRDIQRLYFIRYKGVRMWHTHIEALIRRKPSLYSASGHKRFFMGRKEEILGEALANEPQENTTYATNLAASRLWADMDNRVDTNIHNGPLKITPLHQVHDALCGQFKKEDTAWAVDKIKSYFNNTLIIAGIPLVIPFEGAYGDSWGNLKAGTI